MQDIFFILEKEKLRIKLNKIKKKKLVFNFLDKIYQFKVHNNSTMISTDCDFFLSLRIFSSRSLDALFSWLRARLTSTSSTKWCTNHRFVISVWPKDLSVSSRALFFSQMHSLRFGGRIEIWIVFKYNRGTARPAIGVNHIPHRRKSFL